MIQAGRRPWRVVRRSPPGSLAAHCFCWRLSRLARAESLGQGFLGPCLPPPSQRRKAWGLHQFSGLARMLFSIGGPGQHLPSSPSFLQALSSHLQPFVCNQAENAKTRKPSVLTASLAATLVLNAGMWNWCSAEYSFFTWENAKSSCVYDCRTINMCDSGVWSKTSLKVYAETSLAGWWLRLPTWTVGGK